MTVVWSLDSGPQQAGRLDVNDAALVLSGGSRETPSQQTIAYSELQSVQLGRGAGERLGGRTTVVAELHDGRKLAIAGVAAVGAAHELSEKLRAAAANARIQG